MKSYEINFKKRPSSIKLEMVTQIIREFAKNGFQVTREAVLHNYDAWLYDFKSGYLDEENGYFLFTPCKCNPLSFRVETLNGESYQKTYVA